MSFNERDCIRAASDYMDAVNGAMQYELDNLRELVSELWQRLQMAEQMGAEGIIDARIRKRVEDALGECGNRRIDSGDSSANRGMGGA